MTLKDHIIQIVENHQGLKGTELAFHIAARGLGSVELLQALKELVDDGEIVEVEYELQKMPYRTKSFYLPKGTHYR